MCMQPGGRITDAEMMFLILMLQYSPISVSAENAFIHLLHYIADSPSFDLIRFMHQVRRVRKLSN